MIWGEESLQLLSFPVLVALVSVYFVSKGLLLAFTGSARNVPGPWHTRFTNLRLKYAVLMGERPFYIDELHNKYGPYVRISPTEVAVADLQGMRAIHKVGSKYRKSDWYLRFSNEGGISSFSMTDQNEHARRRRMLSRPYSHVHLSQHWEGVVRERVELCISLIKDHALKGTTDVMALWMLLASDVSAQAAFGESFNMLESGKLDTVMLALKRAGKRAGMQAELPILNLLRYLPKSAIQQLFNAGRIVEERARRGVELARTRPTEANVLHNIIEDSEKEGGISDADLRSEARLILIAGTDTTALTLTYLVWSVLQLPELQAALEEEVANLPMDFRESDVAALSLLNATIDETLRLYSPVAGSLPRVVPPGGAKLGSHFIPEDCTVSTQAYTLHRDPKIWKDPLKFSPDRWLLGKEDPGSALRPDAKSAYHPFGAGSRVCAGMHLARMELRYAVAMFFRELKGARLGPSATPESMKFKSFFISSPVSGKCEITLAPLS